MQDGARFGKGGREAATTAVTEMQCERHIERCVGAGRRTLTRSIYTRTCPRAEGLQREAFVVAAANKSSVFAYTDSAVMVL